MTVQFDTLTFAKRLTQAGEKPEVAEAHAMAFKDFVMDTIATKADILDLRGEFVSLDKKVSERFATKDDLLAVKQELRTEIGLLRKDIDAMGLKLTVRMGGMLAVAVGALATMSKVL